eukprot:TRINITY_DN3140_c0_g5_i1.p1 TRINITY_DN3140_c0_g5~~TRINITY_DN3140_c0_g5_i1.p1  ORF type:complete len:601 (-),score=119.58 TRINITY_DN3140_c0_g5_i1:50-1852(-)
MKSRNLSRISRSIRNSRSLTERNSAISQTFALQSRVPLLPFPQSLSVQKQTGLVIPRREISQDLLALINALGGMTVGVVTVLFYYFKTQDTKKEKLVRTTTQNILDRLKERFVPPLQPDFGPVFDRGQQWRESFLSAVNGKMYHLYTGTGAVGKSTAIQNVLAGREAVIYFSLRGVDADQVVSRFAIAVGFFGEQSVPITFNDIAFWQSFYEALRARKNHEEKKPLVLIEDIHKFCSGRQMEGKVQIFVETLVDLYNYGFINVCYTASDFESVAALRNVTGHRARLKIFKFPPIPDVILVEQLESLVYEKRNEEKEYQHSNTWTISPRKDNKDENRFFFSAEHAQYIVSHLGCHMGDIVECLRGVLYKNRTPQEAVDTIVEQSNEGLYSILTDISEESEFNYAMVEISNFIFQQLAVFGTDSIPIVLIFNTYSYIPVTCRKVVRTLMDMNILVYSSPSFVSFASRKFKWAFSKLCSNDPLVVYSVQLANAYFLLKYKQQLEEQRSGQKTLSLENTVLPKELKDQVLSEQKEAKSTESKETEKKVENRKEEVELAETTEKAEPESEEVERIKKEKQNIEKKRKALLAEIDSKSKDDDWILP